MLPESLSLLARLVAFDTRNPEGNELPALEYCAELLRAFGPDELELESVPRARGGPPTGWVFARFGTPRVLFNAHIDTVPVSGVWSGSPFELRRDGDRALGLGVADTKCGIAAFLTALTRVSPRDVAVLISGDEEHGNEAMQAFLARRDLGGLELALVTEPTDGLFATEHRGILYYEIKARGPGGHSSRADERRAPVLELARVASKLGDWAEEEVARGRGSCLNIAEIKSGAAFNVIPSEAVLVVSARPAPGVTSGEVRREFDRILREVAPDLELEVRYDHPSFRASNPELLTAWLGEGAPARSSVPFWTEAALLQERSVNAVVYGPGAIAEAHRADEGLDLGALAQAESLFERVLRALR
jgi:acetylornithine deacetylase/succinyl-diaminopimelate desuccinylase-like protein